MSRYREEFRYFTILNGASLTNEDESGNPIYYGYTRPGLGAVTANAQDNSTFVILEFNTTAGTYRFFLGRGNANFDAQWANRANLVYKKAGEFKKL